MTRFFTFCLLVLPLCLSAQSYLNQTSTWRYRGGSAGFSGLVDIYDRRFYFDGDTSIAGQTYFKLYFDRQDTTYSWNTGGIVGIDSTLHTYHGAMREDTKQFYMVFFYETQENLIQDFDLTVGDTIPWSGCWETVTVTAVDTVYLGATPLKRFFLNGFTNEFIVEGACGTDGFRVGCPGSIVIEGSLDPACYGRDGHTVPFVLGQPDCSVGSGTSGASKISARPLRFYPNPSTGLIYLDLSAEAGRQTVQVFNARGEKMLIVTQQNGTLDLSALPNGIYCVAVTTGAGIRVGKVVLAK